MSPRRARRPARFKVPAPAPPDYDQETWRLAEPAPARGWAWLRPVAVACGALGFGFMLVVGLVTFQAWLRAPLAPVFAVGDCIALDEPYERWQTPSEIRIIEEVGARAYRYRTWAPRGRGGWIVIDGDGYTMPFRTQTDYRRYPCAAETDAVPEVDRLRPRDLRE